MARLVYRARWAALAVCPPADPKGSLPEEGGSRGRAEAPEAAPCPRERTFGPAPVGAMVAVAPAPAEACLLLHLSRLAAHTRALLAGGAATLVVSEPDDGRPDPQTLARAVIAIEARVVGRGEPARERLRAAYLARLPAAERLFGFGDFELFACVPRAVRFVGGFAAAHTFSGEILLRELRRLDEDRG